MEDNGKYLLSLGETFDDFSMMVFVREDVMHFVWKLNPPLFFEYPGYAMNVCEAALGFSFFCKVVNEFFDVCSED